MSMIYVLARDKEAARRYIVSNCIVDNWAYVSGAKTLKELEGRTLVVVNGWHKSRCFIQRMIMNRALDKFKEHNIILYRSE